MRILCAAAAYPPHGKGGGPKASEATARALVGKGHTVRVITVADAESTEVRDGVEIKTLPSLNVYWDLEKNHPFFLKLLWHVLANFNPRAFLRMRKEISSFKPDVVVTISTENINVGTWIAAKSLGLPVIHMIHSYVLMCWRGGMFVDGHNCETQCRQCRLTSIGKKICSQSVDGVISEAPPSLAIHKDHGYFRNAAEKVIPGEVIPPAHPNTRTIADKGPIRVGFIGAISEAKGIMTLAQAAQSLGKGAPFEYVVAGDGDPGFVAEVKSAFPPATATFLGWADRDEFYHQVDVVVVPSIWREPFGNVSIEALSYGVPAVVARSGGLALAVEPEKSGLIFTPGDAQELADCLRRLDEDRPFFRRLREVAPERARFFSPEKMAASLNDFVGQIAAERRSGS